jgi:hypothetical protein
MATPSDQIPSDPQQTTVMNTSDMVETNTSTEYILILAGQSNTVGRGDPITLPADLVARVPGAGGSDNAAAEDVKNQIGFDVRIAFDLEAHRPDETHRSDGWVALTPECQANPHFGLHFGPEWGTLDVLRKRFPRLRIAKFAMGSSSLLVQRPGATEPPEWSADSRHRQRFLEWLGELRESLSATQQGGKVSDQTPTSDSDGKQLRKEVHFIGCLWNQGNSDLTVKVSNGSSAKYTERLKQFIVDLRAATSHPQLPFIATEVCKGSKPKNTKDVNAAIREACTAAGPGASCLPLPPNFTLIPGDDFHLDGKTLLAAGAEAAAELLRLIDANAAAQS